MRRPLLAPPIPASHTNRLEVAKLIAEAVASYVLWIVTGRVYWQTSVVWSSKFDTDPSPPKVFKHHLSPCPTSGEAERGPFNQGSGLPLIPTDVSDWPRPLQLVCRGAPG